jgi:hypothetical protein
MEKDKNSLLLKEKESLNQTIKDKDERLTARAVTYWLSKIAAMQELHTKVLIAQEGQLQVA